MQVAREEEVGEAAEFSTPCKAGRLFAEAALTVIQCSTLLHPPERLLELSVCTLMLKGLNHPILPGTGAGAWEHTAGDLHKVTDLHGVENLHAVNS